MKRSWALDRLLTRARFSEPFDDAELRRAGVPVDDAVQAAILRALAACGKQSHPELMQWCQLDPAFDRISLNRIQKALAALARRKSVLRSKGSAWLSPELTGRFARIDALDAPDRLEAPTLDLKGLVAARPRRKSVAPAYSVTDALDALDAEYDAQRAAAHARALAERTELQALFDWVGPAVISPSWRAALTHAIARVGAATVAVTGEAPDLSDALAATWINFLARHQHLTPERLNKEAPRREELIRRWAWFAGARIRGETWRASAKEITKRDVRRLDAERAEAELNNQIRKQRDKLVKAERKRREEAAAYAATRRE